MHRNKTNFYSVLFFRLLYFMRGRGVVAEHGKGRVFGRSVKKSYRYVNFVNSALRLQAQ